MREILTRWSRLAALFLPLLLLSYLPARADQRTSDFNGGSDDGGLVDPSRREGDPLDTNDVGDDDPDPQYEQADGVSFPSGVQPLVIGDKKFVVIPVSRGGVLTFELLLIDIKVAPEEG